MVNSKNSNEHYVFLIELDFLAMVVTLVTSVFLGLEIGVMIGIVLNLATLLYFSARPSVIIAAKTVSRVSIHDSLRSQLKYNISKKCRI